MSNALFILFNYLIIRYYRPGFGSAHSYILHTAVRSWYATQLQPFTKDGVILLAILLLFCNHTYVSCCITKLNKIPEFEYKSWINRGAWIHSWITTRSTNTKLNKCMIWSKTVSFYVFLVHFKLRLHHSFYLFALFIDGLNYISCFSALLALGWLLVERWRGRILFSVSLLEYRAR